MKIRSKLLALTLAIMATGQFAPQSLAEKVVDFNEDARSCIAHDHSDWGYYGQVSPPSKTDRQPILQPNDWGQQFATCGAFLMSEHRQSPLELPMAKILKPTKSAGDVQFGKHPGVRFAAEHNCHTLQATVNEPERFDDSALVVGGQAYRMLQFHLHTPSEHVIDSGGHGAVNYPAEIHFVHGAINEDGSIDSSRLAVIGLFLDIAHDDVRAEPLIDEAMSEMARRYQGADTQGQGVAPLSIDIDLLFEKHTDDYYRYQGSLTTPPCSEVVDWIVLRKPAVVSISTYRMLQDKKLDVGFANARPAFLPTPQHTVRRFQN